MGLFSWYPIGRFVISFFASSALSYTLYPYCLSLSLSPILLSFTFLSVCPLLSPSHFLILMFSHSLSLYLPLSPSIPGPVVPLEQKWLQGWDEAGGDRPSPPLHVLCPVCGRGELQGRGRALPAHWAGHTKGSPSTLGVSHTLTGSVI